MAIKFDRISLDDYAWRSATGFDHNAAYTALVWFNVLTDPNDYQHFIHVGGTIAYDANTDFIGTDLDGTTFRYGCVGGASDSFLTSGSITPATWMWCALVRESTTSLKVYRGTNTTDGVLVATLTNNVSARAASIDMSVGGYNAANINGPIAVPRFWAGTALSLAQLHTEVGSATPVVTSGLWTAPAFSGADFTAALADTSGNGRDWTRSGTDSSIVADPPFGGGQTVTAPLLTNTSTLYAPTVVQGVVVLPPLLANTSVLYGPTVAGMPDGARGQYIVDNTGPQGGNPAGILYNDVNLPADADKWFHFVITTPPATGTLDINPDGSFTFVGPNPETMYYQLYVDNVAVGSPQLVELYTQGNVFPGLLTNTSVLYAPTISVSTVMVTAPLLTNTSTLYSPTVTVSGTVSVTVPLLTNTSTLFAPAVSGGAPPVSSGNGLNKRLAMRLGLGL